MSSADATLRFVRVALPEGGARFARHEPDGSLSLLDDAPWLGGAPTGLKVGAPGTGPEAAEAWLPPVVPTKIVCVGRNYRAHARELGHEVPAEPLLFLKPPSALIGPEGTVRLPPAGVTTEVEHEAELGVVVGRRARDLDEAGALEHVFGYTAVCDVTARDLQRRDGQWTRAKGFDTFCPVGPAVVTGLDPGALGVRCRVGGVLRQEGTTRDMIFSVPALLAYISRVMTLEPGDLVATGTPEGVGPLASGDRLEVEVDFVGVLSVVVR